MKKYFPTALIVSFTLNSAFSWIFWPTHEAKSSTDPLPIAAAVGPPPIDAHFWPDLKTEDLPTLVSRLRAAGFPKRMIRAILKAQLDELFAARRRALISSKAGAVFWKESHRDVKTDQALRDLSREEEKLLSDLMGDSSTQNVVRPALAFLPPEKAEATQQLENDFAKRRSELWASGVNESTDRDKFKALDQQLHDALTKLLTPSEMLDYDLRESETAERLRERLAAFDPTEAEFRTIYSLQTGFDDKWGIDYDVAMSAERKTQREADEKLVAAQIKAVLPADRANQYERATDWNYINTSQLVARLELPPETTDLLYSIQQEFQNRRSAIYQTKTADVDPAPQLTALQQEALERITLLLGNRPSAVAAYEQHGGSWIKYLVPQSPTKH